MTIEQYFLNFFEIDGEPLKIIDDCLCSSTRRFPIRNGIPIITPDISYAENFLLLREKHSELQLDSRNGTTDRFDTILSRTQWPVEFFNGKTVLECGCGAGPDTEILLSLGCKVMGIDLTGSDIAKKNNNNNPNAQFIQGSITDIPLKKKSFDIVFCHRVLQHTPDPDATLAHILQYVKDDGAVFVHSYANTFIQRFRWKYFLLPITRNIPSITLYKMIQWYSRPMFHITNVTGHFKIGRIFNWIFIPFYNHRRAPQFANLTNEEVLERSIHDTFDALSPKYDKPIKASAVRKIAASILKKPYEVYEGRYITLLRTKMN